MNLVTALAESVRKHPQKPALFWGEREYSYPELWKQTVSVGARLRREFGVQPGDRVGLWLKNCPEFIPAFFGILHAGGVVVPINNFFKPNEVSYIIEDSGIDVLITDEELAVHFGALAAARPRLQLLVAGQSWLATDAEETTGAPRTESDLAVIIYTSGTTGRPKGAMLSHGNLLHNVESCRLVLQMVDLDRLAVMLPMFHSYMLTVGMLLPLLIGGSVVLVKSLHPVRNALQEIVQREATVLPAIPQFYRSMAGMPVNGPLPIRIFVSGAAPLPAQVLKEFEARFQRPLIEGYGLSEASPVVTKNPLNGTHKPGSIGLPIPHVEVSIQDDAGRELPAKEIGELCVRGGNVMLGYWKKPEETDKVMRNGWLLTGDIGYRDDEGYYFITDRKKDMLLVNGINVYPREIEEILYQFPGIKEAAVIGRPDPRKGEQPVAYVSVNEGVALEERAVQSFVRQQLADYKVPKRVFLLPALPRNATGKILKTVLREMN
jgi:long-chain acyl-CoA synthetase